MDSLENRLIARLPPADRRRLLACCEPVDLLLGDVLSERDDTTRHAYFPIDGFVSLVTQVDAHPGIEVGMVGCEGMLGVELALGVARTPVRALVQGPGRAWRIGSADFQRELAASSALRQDLGRYLYVLMAQLATSASCLRYHLIGPRLARWLLMSHDRAHADRFRITHEFLAFMLGVRRAGISTSAKVLQRTGLIEYRRGELTVIDRPGLELAACSCYAADRSSYANAFA